MGPCFILKRAFKLRRFGETFRNKSLKGQHFKKVRDPGLFRQEEGGGAGAAILTHTKNCRKLILRRKNMQRYLYTKFET